VIAFYAGFSGGGAGASRELLSGGYDRALRKFSLIQDHQSRELSQVRACARDVSHQHVCAMCVQGKLASVAKHLGRYEAQLKLPPVIGARCVIVCAC
jgi:hypothetical protein